MLKGSNKKHILISVPTGSTQVHAPVASFTCMAMREGFRRNAPFRFHVQYLVGTQPIEYARNVCVTTFLDKPFLDALWFIDSDMVPPDDGMRLMSIYDQADIIGGIAPIFSSRKLDEPAFTYNCYHRVKGKDKLEMDYLPINPSRELGVQDVDGLGTAFMLIKRRVLEDRRMWLQPEREKDIVPMFTWHRSITGETIGTDDLDFCKRATSLGYTIKIIPFLACGHMKEMDLKWVIDKLHYTTREIPEHLITMNDLNRYIKEAGGYCPPRISAPSLDTSLILSNSPQPLSEALPQFSGDSLIAPTAAR